MSGCYGFTLDPYMCVDHRCRMAVNTSEGDAQFVFTGAVGAEAHLTFTKEAFAAFAHLVARAAHDLRLPGITIEFITQTTDDQHHCANSDRHIGCHHTPQG